MPQDWLSFAFIAAFGLLVLIRALQITWAGIIAPFKYCGPLFAVLWGALAF